MIMAMERAWVFRQKPQVWARPKWPLVLDQAPGRSEKAIRSFHRRRGSAHAENASARPRIQGPRSRPARHRNIPDPKAPVGSHGIDPRWVAVGKTGGRP